MRTGARSYRWTQDPPGTWTAAHGPAVLTVTYRPGKLYPWSWRVSTCPYPEPGHDCGVALDMDAAMECAKADARYDIDGEGDPEL